MLSKYCDASRTWIKEEAPTLTLALIFSVLTVIAVVTPDVLKGSYVAPAVWTVLVVSIIWTSWRLPLFFGTKATGVERIVASIMLFAIITSTIIAFLIWFSVLTLGWQIFASGVVTLMATRLPLTSDGKKKPSALAVKPVDVLTVGGLASGSIAWVLASWHQVRYIVQDADNMIYHLTMVAEWILTGSTWRTDIAHSDPRVFWPGFKESSLAFLSLPMGNEHLAILGVVELPLLAFFIYGLTRYYRVRRSIAVLTATYAATTPEVVSAAMNQGNDLCLAVNFCAAVFFLLLHIKTPKAGYAFMSGLALGALAATKYSGVIYTGLLIVAACIMTLSQWDSRSKNVVCARNSVLIIIGLLLVAGPWYVRNVILFANPFYPGQMKIGELVLFNGFWVLNRDFPSVGWDIRPLLTIWRHWFLAFGILVPFMVLSSFPGSMALFASRATRDKRIMLLLLPPGLMLAFLHHPSNIPEADWAFNMRYLLPWYSISLVTIVVFIGRLRYFNRYGGGLLLCAAFGNTAVWTRWWPLVVIVCLATMLVAALYQVETRAFFRGVGRGIEVYGIMVCLLVVLVAYSVNTFRSRQQYDHEYGYHDAAGDVGWGPIVAYSHRHIRGKRIVVCGSGSISIFPLYGEPFSNRVFVGKTCSTPRELITLADMKRADYIITFASKPLGSFGFGESLGLGLLAEVPGRVSIQLESRGSYLLRLISGQGK